jgi:ribonuclease HII
MEIFDGYIGVDEAGRGCLAGPVVAAAAFFPANFSFKENLPGLNDSKKLSAKTRERLTPAIKRQAMVWRIGISWPGEIDEINILNATFRAMSRAVSGLRLDLPMPPIVIDGNHVIKTDAWNAVCSRPLPEQKAVINGDTMVPQIAAASILAKTFRDALMAKLDRRYPGYGFAAHKGYGTKEHREAILRLLPCPMHRKIFRGVRPEETQLPLF